jgi:hypothetical protein
LLTESEYLALKVLQKKGEPNTNLYFSAREVGEDDIFQRRSTPTFRPAMNAGIVLGNLRRKALVDMALLVEDGIPIRFYRINKNGLKALELHDNAIYSEYERLLRSCHLAFEYARTCFEQLERFKEQHGIN